MKYILVDLPNFAKEHHVVKTREEMWLYLLANAGKSDALPDFDDDLVARAIERIRITTADKELLSRQAKEMVTQDEIDVRIADGIVLGREQGREEGLVEGHQKGLAEGFQKGMAKGEIAKAREMAKSFKSMGFPLEAIAKASGLTEEEILAL